MTGQAERLRIVSIQPTEDFVQEDEVGTLPERYSLLLGMSRRITSYELAEVTAETSVSFVDSGDPRWLRLADTTLDEFAERRHEIQQIVDDAVSKAAVYQEVAETTGQAHAAAQQAEYIRRRKLMSDINVALRSELEQNK
ncbi:hypothetical protein [Mycobacterium bourgelatii]|uniref:Uncharacterized protein n=1 Tax=Mycobacterium bourgelatii TaxID=1273442 RepID=A0A7I9YMR8_MYCBU|nr:hypothetical protein [Mycobacterium bourgelatii]MCV6975637.1 hypothetical protein [Mycobacterium bourgelatii]GFG89949.1 hypothetical protein MBOU_19910 [Mycobacterium bourgelatii]